MRLTTKGRYAVTAVADIAAVAGDGPVSIPDVAERQGISASYLEQLFARLRRAGLLTSARGAGGGYRLGRPATEIRIAEIVAAVDEPIKTTACSPGADIGCQGSNARCLTHDLWDELGRQIEIFLNAATIDDVVNRRILGMASVNPPAGQREAEGAEACAGVRKAEDIVAAFELEEGAA